MGLSRRGYAAHRAALGLPGATDAAVRKALQTGRITLEADGSIDPVKADRLWSLTTDANKQRSPDSVAQGVDAARETIERGEVRPVPTSAVAAVHETAADAPEGGGLTFAKARTAEMALRVQRNRILLKRLSGEVVDRKAVVQHVFDLARKERDHWLQLPARAAAGMAADLDCDAHQLEVLLDATIREHLSLLAEIKVDLSASV